MLRAYNRYRRKLVRLKRDNKNERRQFILQKHIAKLKDKLQGLFSTIKLTTSAASLALGAFVLTPNLVNAQTTFLPKEVNPFGISATNDYQSSPVFADLDGDGDMDMLTGEYIYDYDDDFYTGIYENNFKYYENIGDEENPVFAAPQTNPFGIQGDLDYDRYFRPSFVDIDGDGDFDIVYGDDNGDFYFMENSGTTTAPNFEAPVMNPFGLGSIITGYGFPDAVVPTFIDIDNDGDFDLIAGGAEGDFYYVENIGTTIAPSFAAVVINPFNLSSVGGYQRSSPSFADIDGDGDFDLLSGQRNGNFYYFENTGTQIVPDFATSIENPFGLTQVGNNARQSTPSFVDLDGDGSYDVFAGDEDGDFSFYRSCPSVSSSITVESACRYTSPSGEIYNTSGIYESIIESAAGCDSVITINLTIVPIADQPLTIPNPVLCESSATTIDLDATQEGVSYFLRRDDDNSIVDGPIVADGSSISLTTDVITDPTTYNVYGRVANDSTGIAFDGIDNNSKRIDCGNDPSVQISGTEITLEAWVYPTEWRNNVSEGCVINKEFSETIFMGPTTDQGYMLRIGNDGQVNFNLGDGSWNELNSPVGALSLDTWQHVSATYDGSTMSIYVDGALVASESKTINFSSPNSNLTIGNFSDGDGRFFIGTIDEVRIWNIARTQTEIQATMDNCLSGSETGLAAYYQFEEGTGSDVATDLSPNQNTGELQNLDLNEAWVDGFEMECILCELEMTETATISVAPTLEGTNNTTICNNESIVINGTTYDATNSTGVEVFENIGEYGCDSTVTVNLIVLPELAGTNNSTICFEDSLIINGTTYNALNPTGTEIFTNIGDNGCDSTVTVDLDILPAVETTIDPALCATESIVVDGTTYDILNPTGVIVFEGASVNGCDSTVIVNLDFSVAPDISTDVSEVINNDNNTVLIADQGNAQYQWLDCNDNFSEILGATQQTFLVQENGSYAVAIMVNGCMELSDCVTISTLSTFSPALNEQVTVYPNPTNALVHVALPSTYIGETIELTNAMGQVIESKQIMNEEIDYDLRNFADGIYFIQVHTEQGIISKKVIKN